MRKRWKVLKDAAVLHNVSPEKAFAHRVILGLLFSGMIFLGGTSAAIIGPTAREWLSDQRWWRDLMRQTPFYDVHVTDQQILPAGLMLMGTMRKRSCVPIGMIAYVTIDGIRHRTSVDYSQDDSAAGVEGRAPTRGPQAFGPWIIQWAMPKPEAWSIWVRHDCPGEVAPETNLFARGEWK